MTPDERIKEYEQSLRETVSSRQGRFVMNWIYTKGTLGQPTMFTGNSTTFHNLGMHDLAAEIMADIERLSPENFLRMTRERVEEK